MSLFRGLVSGASSTTRQAVNKSANVANQVNKSRSRTGSMGRKMKMGAGAAAGIVGYRGLTSQHRQGKRTGHINQNLYRNR